MYILGIPYLLQNFNYYNNIFIIQHILNYNKICRIHLFYELFIYVLAVPQTNSWQLETTNQDSTSTVNTPMDCKGKTFICIICKIKGAIIFMIF